MIRGYKKKFIIIQFYYPEHFAMISQIKSSIYENSNITHSLLLIHLEKPRERREILKKSIGINFWDEWDCRVLDNIIHTNYEDYIKFKELSINDILFKDNYKIGNDILKDIIKNSVVSIIHQNNDKSLREHLKKIIMMLDYNNDNGHNFLSTFRKKIHQSSILNESWNGSWLTKVDNSSMSNETYVDFELELLRIANSLWFEQIKKAIILVNSKMSNLAGFSIGLTNSDENIRNIYEEKMSDSIEGIQMNTMVLKRAQHSNSFFRVPFLKDNYDKFFTELYNFIFNENEKLFKKIYDLRGQISIVKNNPENQDTLQYGGNAEENVFNGEKFIVENCSTMMERFKESVLVLDEGEQKTQEYFINMVSDDIFSYLLNNKRYNIQEKYVDFKYFKAICQIIYPQWKVGKMYDITKLITAGIYAIAVYTDQVKFLLEIMKISNFDLKKLNSLIQKISKKAPTNYEFKVDNIEDFTNLVQVNLIPDFSNQENVSILKSKLEEIIFNISSSSKKVDYNKNEILSFFELIVLLLNSVELISEEKRPIYLREIETSINKNSTKESVTKFIFEFLKKLFIESRSSFINTDLKNVEKYVLLISELIKLEFKNRDFNFLIKKDYDVIFKDLKDENYLSQITSCVASEMISYLPRAFTYSTLKTLFTKKNKHDRINLIDVEIFSKINPHEKKWEMFIIGCIDSLYLRAWIEDQTADYYRDIEDIINFVILKTKDIKNYLWIEFWYYLAILRRWFPKANIEKLSQAAEKESLNKVDDCLKDYLIGPDDFINQPLSFIAIYFLQKSSLIDSDLERFTGKMKLVNNISIILIDNQKDPSKIVVFGQEMRTYEEKLVQMIHNAALKSDTKAMSKVFNQKFKGSNEINLYLIGINVINMFWSNGLDDNGGSQNSIFENIKKIYLDSFSSVVGRDEFVRVVKFVIMGGSFEFLNFFNDSESSSQKKVQEVRKLVFQFLLMITCFKEIGYDFNVKEIISDKGISYSKFKAPIVNSENISNYWTVYSAIIIDRLSDGSYQDYGHGLGKNLGIYRCSWMYVYSIMNWGYAVEKSLWPRCKKEIGGAHHKFLQRDGHIHVTSIEEFTKMIKAEYESKNKFYNPHTPFNDSSTETLWMLINELDYKFIIDNRNSMLTGPINNYKNILFIRHLFDHMYMITLTEVVSKEDKKQISEALDKNLNFKDQQFKELYKIMSGREVKNPIEYLLAHIKSDIENIQSKFRLANQSEAISWVSSVISKMTEKLAEGKKLELKSMLIDDEDILRPNNLLSELEKRRQESSVNKEDSIPELIQCILKKKILATQLVLLQKKDSKGQISDRRPVIGNIFKFLRHFEFDRLSVIIDFEKRVTSSEYELLKHIVKYQDILKDFPRIVKANIDLPLYLTNYYNRIYNFDEAAELELSSLNDPKINELFEEFKYVWTTIIPKYEDKNPEVFSFAFMCQQNLNVANFIDGIFKKGGDKMIKFLFVDPEEYPAVDLLYIKSIVRTFIEKFHNKIVGLVYHVLNLTESDQKQISVDF